MLPQLRPATRLRHHRPLVLAAWRQREQASPDVSGLGYSYDTDWTNQLVPDCVDRYPNDMIQVRFPDAEMERKAIGFLAGRFSFKTFADGHTLVPELALARMASEGITLIVEGRAAYEQSISTVQDPSASKL